MNHNHYKLFILFIFLILFGNNKLSAANQENRYSISLLTYDEGTELYAIFGHSAIRVVDHKIGTDYIYNYGTFSFDSPNFYLSFLKGKLQYRLSKLPTPFVLKQNNKNNRGIIENKFILTEEESNKLATNLEINYLPQNRAYLYDFFYDNCATRILMAVDSIHKFNTSEVYPSYSELSFRQHTNHYLATKPWTRLGISILMGSSADKVVAPKETSFLPMFLLKIFKENSTILLQKEVILVSGTEFSKKDNKTAGMTFFIISLSSIIISTWGYFVHRRNRTLDHLLIWPAIITSFLLISLWIYSSLDIYTYNMDLLWANPILLLFLFNKKRNSFWNLIMLISLTIAIIYTIWFTKEYAIVFYSTAIATRILLKRTNLKA